MDDLQLQGRLKRYPQSKGVEIYRLIAARTADETIQMLSTGKGKIHEKFTSASLAFRECSPDVIIIQRVANKDLQRRSCAAGSTPMTPMTIRRRNAAPKSTRKTGMTPMKPPPSTTLCRDGPRPSHHRRPAVAMGRLALLTPTAYLRKRWSEARRKWPQQGRSSSARLWRG